LDHVLGAQPRFKLRPLCLRRHEQSPAGYVTQPDQAANASQASRSASGHLATTFDGRVLTLVNGELESQRTFPGASCPVPALCGGNTIWGEYFRGLIDEVRIYGRSQSPEDIRADMQRPVRASCR
jgi:hypothetical protein